MPQCVAEMRSFKNKKAFKVLFFFLAAVTQSREKWGLQLPLPDLCSSSFVLCLLVQIWSSESGGRRRWWGETKKKLVGTSFKSDVLKHFSFSVPRNEKGEKVRAGQKSIHRQCRNITITKIHFGDLFAHIVTSTHQLFCIFDMVTSLATATDSNVPGFDLLSWAQSE